MLAPRLALESDVVARDLSWRAALSSLHAAGCEGVVLQEHALGEFGRAAMPSVLQAREDFATSGLAIAAFDTDAARWDSVGDGDFAAECLARLEACATLGASELRVRSGLLPRHEATLTERALVAQAAHFWRGLAGEALSRKIRMLLYPRVGDGWTAARLTQVLRAVDSPNFGIVFDTLEMAWLARAGEVDSNVADNQPDVVDLVDSFKGDIGAIVLADMSTATKSSNSISVAAPGAGTLDWDRIIPALADAWVPSPWWTIRTVDPPQETLASIAFFRDNVASRFADALASPADIQKSGIGAQP